MNAPKRFKGVTAGLSIFDKVKILVKKTSFTYDVITVILNVLDILFLKWTQMQGKPKPIVKIPYLSLLPTQNSCHGGHIRFSIKEIVQKGLRTSSVPHFMQIRPLRKIDNNDVMTAIFDFLRKTKVHVS